MSHTDTDCPVSAPTTDGAPPAEPERGAHPDGRVVLDLARNRFLKLSPTAAAMVRRLVAQQSEAEIARALAAQYGVEAARMARDLAALRLGPDLFTWDGSLDNRDGWVRRLGSRARTRYPRWPTDRSECALNLLPYEAKLMTTCGNWS